MNNIIEVKVTRVIDGDTFDAYSEINFFGVKMEVGKDEPLRFRLFGIDALEMRGHEVREGVVSKEWLKELIEGKTVKVDVSKGKDVIGRWLAIVYFEEANVNEELLERGLAKIYERD